MRISHDKSLTSGWDDFEFVLKGQVESLKFVVNLLVFVKRSLGQIYNLNIKQWFIVLECSMKYFKSFFRSRLYFKFYLLSVSSPARYWHQESQLWLN